MPRRLTASTAWVILVVALAMAPSVASAGRNSSGTYTISPGAGSWPFVTGTAISSTTMNSILSDLATGMTDSLARSGKGGMNAPLQCTDGSASFPSLTFSNETTSGFYRIGLSDVGLSLGGTKRWEHTAGGQIETGWLQVAGTATVSDVLSVQYGANRFNVFETRDGNGGVEFVSSVAYLDFKSDPASDYDARIRKNSGTHLAVLGTPLEVPAPVDANDAATKAYVDGLVVNGTTVSTGSGAFSTASGSPVDVTNLSVPIVTRGRPVMVALQPIGGTSTSRIAVTTGVGGGLGYLRIIRDTSVVVAEFNVGSTASSGTYYFTPSAVALDYAPSAGAHTYKAAAYVGGGAVSIDITNLVLVAYEL